MLSLATTSPGRISTSADAVSRTLRDALSKYAVDGTIQEVVESEVLLAFRP
jgi:hypothetical protein